MQEAVLTCVNIYFLEGTVSKDLSFLKYTLNPIKPRAKIYGDAPANVNTAPPDDMVL